MENDPLSDWDRIHLERLKLATDVLLSEAGDIPEPMEEELSLFRDRVERALLLPVGQALLGPGCTQPGPRVSRSTSFAR